MIKNKIYFEKFLIQIRKKDLDPELDPLYRIWILTSPDPSYLWVLQRKSHKGSWTITSTLFDDVVLVVVLRQKFAFRFRRSNIPRNPFDL